MKFGSTKGLLGVLVLVACAQPSAAFGQVGNCQDVEVAADGFHKSGHPDARGECYNNLKAQCKEPHKLEAFEHAAFWDDAKSLNGTYFTVQCSAWCSCSALADPIISQKKPATEKSNTVPAGNK